MKLDIRSHQRVNDIFLASLERPALKWLAEHMPKWMTPDLLTIIGILGSLVTFAGYWLTSQNKYYIWLASFGFIVNWFGDSLDGTLARFRHIERPYYGFFIDHSVDILTEVVIFLGLGLSPYVRFDFACLALIGYLMLSVLVYIRTCVKGEFKISYAGLGPTEARLIAISANTIVFFIGNPSVIILGFSFSIYDWITLGVIALLMGIFISSLFTQSRILSRMDRQPKE